MTKRLNFTFVYLLILFSSQSFAQKSKTVNQGVDILKYKISIQLNNTNDSIKAEAEITARFLRNLKWLKLDLVNSNYTGKGMHVAEVYEDNKRVKFVHKNDIIQIEVSQNLQLKNRNYKIIYHGKPDDGLIIGRNMYGNRTFFGDNWPNRAKNWIPCIDHPSDKAKVEFEIITPSKYQVVANGKLITKTELENNFIQYTYSSKTPIPTKVMVFGAAEFAVKYQDTINNIVLSSWVYPQNKEIGFRKFEVSADALTFFSEKIGPYPFAKLASVQSATIFGGMENAGTIFYPERRVAGAENIESTVVHEIAHQWFGNSATEADFAHIWLSEGFATYLTNLYMEHKYGLQYTHQLLNYQRNRVINFHKRNSSPVVDTLNFDYMSLLNANSYQKGAWILHMLRKKLGDNTFWSVLKEYYEKYKLGNASSEDFVAVAEKVSNKALKDFFKQWLYRSGHPKLKYNWKQNAYELDIEIKQVQKSNVIFKFPLDLQLIYEDGSFEKTTLEINQKTEHQNIKLQKKANIKKVIIDPDLWLLYENG